MKLLLLFMLLQLPLSNAQSVSEEHTPEVHEEVFPFGENSLSESSFESERQEDVLHPEGEVNDWSLGSDDLPSEDFQ